MKITSNRKKEFGKRLLAAFATIFITVTLFAQTKEITILAVNDMHATIERFPKFVALVDSMRTVYPDLLLFAVGDNRTGNPANDMHADSYPMVELMNRAGFNLSAVGNHEFDGNVEGLRSVVNNSNFRYVCANVTIPDSMRVHVEPYKVF
jgi:5'-nucleotidase